MVLGPLCPVNTIRYFAKYTFDADAEGIPEIFYCYSISENKNTVVTQFDPTQRGTIRIFAKALKDAIAIPCCNRDGAPRSWILTVCYHFVVRD